MFTRKKVKSFIKLSLILLASLIIAGIIYDVEANQIGELSFYTPNTTK
jgi:hypothetical protein